MTYANNPVDETETGARDKCDIGLLGMDAGAQKRCIVLYVLYPHSHKQLLHLVLLLATLNIW